MRNGKEIFSANLKQLRGERSQAEFARFIGVKQQIYNRWEGAQVMPGAANLRKIASATEYSVEQLLAPDLGTGTGVALPGVKRISRKVPVISSARAGQLDFDYHDVGGTDELIDTDSKDPNAFALTVEGDSMEPEIRAGDRVVLNPNDEPRNGDTVVAKLKLGEGIIIKIFRRTGPDGRNVKLESLNPDYSTIERPMSEFKWIYPAVELKRKLRR